MSHRLRVVKTILWAFVGVLGVATVVRFAQGLGATTGLNDDAPWGLWIAFDVMAGVALAAGGFVLAATVYIFGLERYRPFVRPAILTAFLGYVAVAVGLLYDLGLPWHIWHPIVFPQHHSVLFEVAMCVMLYLTVLALEFAPVALEHPLFHHRFFQAILKVLKRVTIVLVVAGIVLSTLHQSSLGSLFLIAPYRLHPLWYSPIIYVLFFISAIALGLMTVVMESLASGWLLGHKVRTNLLSGLGLAASVVLGLYVVIRLGELAARGVLGQAFSGSWQGFLFLFELTICALAPAVLLAIRRVRTSIAGLAVCSSMVIFGMVLNRISVCILAFDRETLSYFPTWIEIAVSLGIISGGILVFLFFVENLNVYPEEEAGEKAAPRTSFDPATLHRLTPESIAAPRRYSLAAIVAASLAVVFLPREAVFGPQPKVTPVQSVRTIKTKKVVGGNPKGVHFVLMSETDGAPDQDARVPVMMIDGNRDGRLVPFTHKGHIDELGGDTSCVECHHQNMPLDENTACFECHRDMYEPTDIFEHDSHVAHLGGNAGCADCHTDPSKAKTRETARVCRECHEDMLAGGSPINKSLEVTMTGVAPGYMDAMHGLCIACHEKKVEENSQEYPSSFAECAACHGDTFRGDLHAIGPYAPGLDGERAPNRIGRVALQQGGVR